MNVSDSSLPEVGDPRVMGPGECPWERYGRPTHEAWAGRLGDMLVVQDYASVRAILADARFHQGINVLLERNSDLDPAFVARRRQGLLLRDGPEHARLRKTVVRAFTPPAAEKFRPIMRATMQGLADLVPADGRCDAVSVLTELYPVLVISHVLGAPAEDREFFSRVAEQVLDAQAGASESAGGGLSALVELDSYLGRLLESCRNDRRVGLITDLLDAEVVDGTLSADEIVAISGSLIMAGTDTTRNQLAVGLHLIACHPEVWVDFDAEHIVDELLRFAPISQILLRVATVDVEMHGVVIPAGTLLVLDTARANRSTVVAARPDEFEPDQARAMPHLAFGHGAKYCLGANLARLELIEALNVLHENFATVDLDGETTWRQRGFTQGPISLPLRLVRR